MTHSDFTDVSVSAVCERATRRRDTVEYVVVVKARRRVANMVFATRAEAEDFRDLPMHRIIEEIA